MIDTELREQLRLQGYELEEQEAETRPFPMQQFLTAILAKRRLILLAGVLGLLLGIALGLARHKKYTSTLQLMPPDAASLSTTSTLAALSGNPLAGGFGSGGGLLSSRSPGGTILGILGSPAVQDALIDRFHLVQVFGAENAQAARDRLTSVTELDEDKKSGILSVGVTYKDPALARDMANAYIVELDNTLSNVSTSSARRERVFLEQRLGSLKTEIDTLANQLSTFSTATGTLNPQAQGEALFESAAKAQTELGVAEADLSGLRAVYTDDNTRVRAAQARIASLKGQLAALGGSSAGIVSHSQNGPVSLDGSETAAAPQSSQTLPTIRQLPTLGVTYANLSQRLTTEQAVYATLTRQYELARVEEAKEIPSVKVLSPAQLPVKPSSPTVLFTAIVTCFAFLTIAFVAVALSALIRFAPAATPFKAAVRAITASAKATSAA